MPRKRFKPSSYTRRRINALRERGKRMANARWKRENERQEEEMPERIRELAIIEIENLPRKQGDPLGCLQWTDFRTGKPLGRDLDTGFYQTTMAGGGFDHCYVLDRPRGASQSLCAWASSDKTGISMKMYTTQPGIQLYTGNFLQDCPSPGKGGVPLEKYGGFALETQHFPCSPSHPEFPTTVLRAGKVFRANTTLRFFTGRQCGRL